MHVRTVPPNDRLGEVVITLFGLAHEGAVDEQGRPGFLRAMAMAEATLDETYFTSVPYGVQRTLGEAVGPLARALGYEAVEERFLDESFWRERARADGRVTASNPTHRQDGTNNPGRRERAYWGAYYFGNVTNLPVGPDFSACRARR